MTFTDAAAEVLRLVGKPLHYKEITDLAIEKNLLSHVGKSPEVTMGARLAALLKKSAKENPLVRVKPGVFALREWDDATIKALKERFGDEQLVELTGTIGYYSMLAMTANACELEAGKGAEVLQP